MAKTVATKALLKQLEKLTKRLSEIVARDFPILSEEQLNWKERPERWSIAECFLHLNYVAAAYFPATLKAIAHAKSKHSTAIPNFQRGWLGRRIIGGVRIKLDNQIAKAVETSSKYDPSQQNASSINSQEMLKQFLAFQDSLLQMIQDSKSINLQKTRIPVAFLGLLRISLGDMLQILVYHTERHVVQAQRILYHDNFPGSSSFESLVSTK